MIFTENISSTIIETPRNFGRLDHPDIAGGGSQSRLCGDRIRFELKIKDGCIEDVRFSGNRDARSAEASASMLSETLRGQTLEDAARISQESVIENV